MTKKVLVVRMTDVADVLAIGVPAIRHIQRKVPQAEIHFLTHGIGKDLVSLAHSEVSVLTLEKDAWPDNLFQALEAFLGVAEEIVGHGYDQIINLDTAFMPCFLARFLKDAGEPVQGNYLAISLQQLIEQLQNQTLDANFVNNSSEYLHSTFSGMARWHTNWWESEAAANQGYPEFYLSRCCGFTDLDFDLHIDSPTDDKLHQQAKGKPTIALAVESSSRELQDPVLIKNALLQQGFHVWLCQPPLTLKSMLSGLAVSDLVITSPGVVQWLGASVNCPAMVLCEGVDPRILMPEYASDPGAEPLTLKQLTEGVTAIFEGQPHG